jgi:hypothetical protein
MFTNEPPCFQTDARAALNLEQDVTSYDFKQETAHSSRVSTFATAELGLDLTIEAWPTLTQTFLSDTALVPLNVPGRPRCLLLPLVDRLPKQVLSRPPADMLVLGDLTPQQHRQWSIRVASADTKPKLVLEFWKPYWIMKDLGPMAKSVLTQWSDLRYQSTCRTLNGLQVGGVVDRAWLVVIRANECTWGKWAWPDFPGAMIRPMSNCLWPTGVPRSAYHISSSISVAVPHSDKDAMPARPGCPIVTLQGTRRLRNDELAKGLGTPKGWVAERYPDGRVLTSTVSLHILEGLSPALLKESLQVPSTPLELDSLPAQPPKPDPVPVPFVWKPPDLSHGSPWYRARVDDLLAACLCYKNPGPLMEEGLNALRLHRGNYDADGPSPTHLQLLWWMFPKEHWDELREGCSMNFLVEPRHELTPNSVMDEEQIVIGEEFLNELVSLGTLVQVTADEIVANGPLFCLPKPGQPGQWRILADMRRGGQNEAIGADPTVFPKLGSILEQMYTGGWSAVIDASKFFYQCPTRKDERKYLGCIHPRWADLFYVYCGLPMGAGNSPSIAGRYGAAFQRLLRSRSSLFQGTPGHNTWWGVYQHGTPYNPQSGKAELF